MASELQREVDHEVGQQLIQGNDEFVRRLWVRFQELVEWPSRSWTTFEWRSQRGAGAQRGE